MTVKTHTIGLRGDDPYYLRMQQVRRAKDCSWAEASRIVYQEMQDKIKVAQLKGQANSSTETRAHQKKADTLSKELETLRIRCARAEHRFADVKEELKALRALRDRFEAITAIAAFLEGCNHD